MKPRGNVAKPKNISVRGTGKGHATSPRITHKIGGAVMNPRKAKTPLSNRGK
jgi:hypothetical protein